MVRKLVVIFTSVVLFAAAHAKALGLGEITIDSALNQPLAASIELRQLGGVSLDQITVQLASENDFERFSIEMESFLRDIRFEVEAAGADAFVHMTTADPVREPYLSFVLETSWPSGRLLSEHTVLLDLPAFASNANAVAIQQPVQEVKNNYASNQQFDSQSSSSSATSAATPAMRLAAPADPASEPVVDSALTTSPDSSTTTQPAAGVLAAPAPIDAAAQPQAPSPAQTGAPTPLANAGVNGAAESNETVTIGADDTLWDVAMQVRPDSSVSIQQTMLALQRLNSESFIADNINIVRRGQVLRIPDIEQIRALSSREAMSEVSRQNQLFNNRRNVPLSSQPISAAPTQVPADASGRRGELSVVSVDNAEPATRSASGGQNAELGARIIALENELAVQLEEADRVARQNAELLARLNLLEEQIASAQEIIRLRDLELAQLQQSLAQAPAAAEPVDPPPVITMAPPKSFIQTVLDTLIANTYALLAVVALLILIIVYMLRRRNKAAELEDFHDLKELHDAVPASAASLSAAAAAIRSDKPVVPVIDPDLHEIFNLAESDVDGLSENTAAGAIHVTAVGELLEEVDALLAYERYDEAVSLLQDAIVAEPGRADLRLKLLEICVARHDVIGFKLQETELLDLGDGTVAPRVAELKAQLRGEIDDEILEAGEGAFLDEFDATDDMELALDMEAASSVDNDLVRSGYIVDETPMSSDVGIATATITVDPTAGEDDPEHSIEFDFAVLENEDHKAAASAEATDDLDFKFDSSQFALDEVEKGSIEEESAEKESLEHNSNSDDQFADLQFVDDSLLTDKPADESDDTEDDGDTLEFFADTDEAATKLDLAQAYYEMGDYEGAREILEEVVNEGNEDQVKDARRLLAKI